MTHPVKAAITVGEPNWAPLELVLPACEIENFMYMGRAGEIELYKHWLTRRYLNISADGQRLYRYSDGTYVEIAKAVALDHVRNRNHQERNNHDGKGRQQDISARARRQESRGRNYTGRHARRQLFSRDYRPGEGPSGKLVR